MKPGTLAALFALALLLSTDNSVAEKKKQSVNETEWPAYGGGPEDIRYSGLTQIDRSNVSRLKVAWTYDTADGPGDPQTQPIMVGKVM